MLIGLALNMTFIKEYNDFNQGVCRDEKLNRKKIRPCLNQIIPASFCSSF